MNITVIGPGRWGTFIAEYLSEIGNDVILYGRRFSKSLELLKQSRGNDTVKLNDGVILSDDVSVVRGRDVIVISIASQNLRELCREIKPFLTEMTGIVLCMKGLEVGSGKRLTEIVSEELGNSVKTAVWVGPGHPQEFVRGVPNCMVIDSLDNEFTRCLADRFSSRLIRFYYGTDLIGSEIGAASKNVIGIAAGMLDGLQMSSLKGALMARGTREIARLIEAEGGNGISAYGLCHLGDYEATVFSEFSHNRKFGMCLVRGEDYGMLAEGAFTSDAILTLAGKHSVDLPICRAVYDVIYNDKSAEETLKELFLRSIKNEF